LRQAYAIIKAISKKKMKVIDAARADFIKGAENKGVSGTQANELFDLILKFAGYGFNKSHSTGYAIVAYQTAYLKTYFPSQYMAAFLTFESQAQKVSDWIPYLDECKRAVFVEPTDTQAAIAPIIKTGIEVRPPDVNLSEADFAVVFEDGEQPSPSHGHVRFGLKAIKGVGSNAIEAIISEREGSGGDDDDTIKTHKQPKPYESIFDFCERVLSRGPGALNKATVEALIRAGCFDAVHGRDNRAAMLATVESAMSAGQKAAKDRMSGQGGLFGMGGGDDSVAAPEPDATPLVKATPWSEPETLRQEKETLGFYVSSHPLEQWRQWSDVFTSHTIAQAREQPQDKRVVLVTIVQSVRAIVMKQGKRAGQKMGIVTVEDLTGTMDTVLFADAYARFNHLLEDDEPKFVLGRIDHRRGEPQVIVDALVPIEGVPLRGGKLRLVVAEPRLNGSRDEALQTLAMCLRGDDDNIDANHANGNGNGNGHALSANGSTAVMAAPVASALQPMSKEAAQFVAAESPVVPIQVWVETPDAYVEVEPRLYPELKLCPHAIGPIMHALGPGSARLVGGVAIEMEDPRAKWAKKRS
ncbi:MAG: OB-fold nucleic acid binding domain-containing protein, partial [Planctomycetota bacterium]